MAVEVVVKAAIIDDVVLTVPVSDEVRHVIQAWAEDHGDDLNRRLADFGLDNYSITEPEWHRVVTREELRLLRREPRTA